MQRNRVRVCLTILMAAVLSACASGPSYTEHSASMQPVAPDSGRIFMYRKSSLGAAVQPEVRINDEVVGKAKPKGFFYADLPPGDYDIAASTEAERNLSLSLAAGEEKYVRLEIKMGAFVGHVKPVLVEAAVGKEELQKMKFIGDQF